MRTTTPTRSSSHLRGVLLFGSLILAACSSLSGCTDPGSKAIRAADELFAEGRWEEAATAYSAIPPEAALWRAYGAWRAAVIYRDALHDINRAEEGFLNCTKTFPDSDWGYSCLWQLGDLRKADGRPRAAIDAFRSALQQRPRGNMAEHCLLESGLSYLDLGEYEQARVEWKELLEGFPRSRLAPSVVLQSARSYDLEGRQKDALKAYRLVQRRYPAHSVAPLAAFGVAESLEQLGRLDEAIKAYEGLLADHPNPDAVTIKLEALRARVERRDTKPYEQPDSRRPRRRKR